MDWSFRIESDGTLTPRPNLSEAELAVLEAKLKVALARVHLMMLERRLRADAYPARATAVVVPNDAAEVPVPPKSLLTAQDAIKLLGISRTKFYELIRTGALPSIRLGKLIRVPLAALNRWIGESAGSQPADV
jgi:excisionase family DNA binding protein